MYGCGTSDMKSGVALALHLAVTLPEPALRRDVLLLRGRGDRARVQRAQPGRRRRTRSGCEADFAVLLEPTYGMVEAGCQGTMRAMVTHHRRAGPTRPAPGAGCNAIHAAGEVLRRLAGVRGARGSTIDGCDVPRGPERGPDHAAAWPATWSRTACEVEVNYRFAPGPDRGSRPRRTCARSSTASRSRSTDSAAGRAARAGRAAPAQEFLAAVGAAPVGKLGWTDVARFAALGIPALNFGPGDPNLAHTRDEHVEIGKIRDGAATAAPLAGPGLTRWTPAVGVRSAGDPADRGGRLSSATAIRGRAAPDPARGAAGVQLPDAAALGHHVADPPLHLAPDPDHLAVGSSRWLLPRRRAPGVIPAVCE